jgi:hypothetical protein
VELVGNFVAEAERLVAREKVGEKDTDFSSPIAAIRSSRPDAVYYGGEYPAAGPLARQVAEAGLDIPLMGGDGIAVTARRDRPRMGQELVKRCGWVDDQRLPPWVRGQQHAVAGAQIEPVPGRGGHPEIAVVIHRQYAVDRRTQREVVARSVEVQPGAGCPVQRLDHRGDGDPPAAVEGGHPVDGVRGARDRGFR